METGRKWCRNFIVSFVMMMVILGAIIVVVDPYFHYHKPLKCLAYKIHNERYQNDGIVKHFDYDAIITGTSMTQNFKTSEMDKLFGTKSIKVPFAGAAYKEVKENLERAIVANPNIKMIVWGLDFNRINIDVNAVRFESYPTYLYDNNIANDVQYVFNKTVLIDETLKNVIDYSRVNKENTSFDEYSNWNKRFLFNKEEVLKKYKRPDKLVETVEDQRLNKENIQQNVEALIKDNPNIEFYLFWTPYSIVWFDDKNQTGGLQNLLRQEKEALEILLPYPNVHFFSFFDDTQITTNLGNYKDTGHYHERINSYMLQCMACGEHQLTMENYEQYSQKVWDYYTNFNYDGIFE